MSAATSGAFGSDCVAAYVGIAGFEERNLSTAEPSLIGIREIPPTCVLIDRDGGMVGAGGVVVDFNALCAVIDHDVVVRHRLRPVGSKTALASVEAIENNPLTKIGRAH